MSRTPIPKQQRGGGTSGGDTSYYTHFNKCVGEVPDPKWKELIDEEDYDTIIYDIREDLIAQVLSECYKKYLKREVHKFLIECAHKAFQQIITLHFYIYDDSHKYSPSQDSWVPDAEPELCKPDSWAKGNIPYNVDDIPRNKFQQTDNVFSDYHLIKCNEYPSSHVFDNFTLMDDAIEIIDDDVAIQQHQQQQQEEENAVSVVSVINHMADEPMETSQTSVQFNQYDFMGSISTAEMIPSTQDISIQPNRIISENMFYKIMKANRTSNVSLQASTRLLPRKANAPAWTTIDEVRDEPKRSTSFGPNRYLQMRRECLATIERKPASKK